MKHSRIPLLLQCILFIIPMNIYVIGNWVGSGVQWALFRYQETYLGNSFIPLNRDIVYILNGIVSGRTAVSFLCWTGGALVLAASVVLMVLSTSLRAPALDRQSSLLTILAGVLFLLSVLMQYGPILYSPAGFSIPVGIPAVLITGWFIHRGAGRGSDDAGPGDEPA